MVIENLPIEACLFTYVSLPLHDPLTEIGSGSTGIFETLKKLRQVDCEHSVVEVNKDKRGNNIQSEQTSSSVSKGLGSH
jgi:hypothetical protein